MVSMTTSLRARRFQENPSYTALPRLDLHTVEELLCNECTKKKKKKKKGKGNECVVFYVKKISSYLSF